MELLLSKNPLIQQRVPTNSISTMYNQLVESATNFNIATGFITNDSIAALKQIVEYRKGDLQLSLFIGMNYLSGFTKLQYNAIRDLDSYLRGGGLGRICLSKQALFHGKMYSFMNGGDCLASFVGSSNLGSFVGTSQNYIEADVLFSDQEGITINNYIHDIMSTLGTDFGSLPIVSEFREPDVELLKGYSYVRRLSDDELNRAKLSVTQEYVDIPLKTAPKAGKSNLNSYFGAGKIKGKYSPRGWYEVEIIINKNLKGADLIPTKDDGSFTVITEDGYEFECSRQGDNSKNFRSEKDLKILGRWIKGKMENCGALEICTPVTNETLERFGKKFIRLQPTTSGEFLLSLV